MLRTILEKLSHSINKSHFGLIVLWLLVPIIFQQVVVVNVEKQMVEALTYRATDIADGLLSGMNLLMQSGAISNPDLRVQLIKKLSETKGVESIRVIRAPSLQTQFGTGPLGEQVVDELDRKALATKLPAYTTLTSPNGTHLFRAVVPYIASADFRGTNCLSCHTVENNSVIGAVSVVINMDESAARVEEIKRYVWAVDASFALFLIIAMLWKQAVERNQFLANYDPLTKLPNRTLLYDRLKRALVSAKRDNDKIAILFIDLDNFKNINDSLGHTAGDLLLQQFSMGLSKCVRKSDTIARAGGDEFIIMLLGIKTEHDVILFLNKVYEFLAKPIIVDRQEIFASASIGIALSPEDGTDGSTLLKNADVAMYRAKRSGKGHYEFYNANMNLRAKEFLTLENKLHHAIDRNEFVLYYQPQVNVATGKIIGVEALIRWKHPELGLVPPGEFIPIAEGTRLIVTIGKWILYTACMQIAEWQKMGIDISMSINISIKQIEESGLIDTVNETIRITKVNPRWIVLELTETVLARQPGIVNNFMEPLKKQGIRLALDDFGTGYSSLSYLKSLPVDIIKIDKTFVNDLTGKPHDEAIVQAIITLAHSLGMVVLAEGVENQQQRDTLYDVGCDEIQGYLFSKPLPADVVTALLIKNMSGMPIVDPVVDISL